MALAFTEQDTVSPQPIPPIRKLPQTSYPHPSEGRWNENHNPTKLNNLMTRLTALSVNKLWVMSCRATKDGWVMVESSDKMWSAGEGNGKPLQHSCLENPINSMKRQKDMTPKDELLRSVGAKYTTGEEQRNSYRKNDEAEAKWKQHPVMDVSCGESKVQWCKEQYCIGTWNVRSMKQGKLEVIKQEIAKWTSTFQESVN